MVRVVGKEGALGGGGVNCSRGMDGSRNINIYLYICKKVRTKCGSPPRKWFFLVGCSSPFFRATRRTPHGARAWFTRCVPGR